MASPRQVNNSPPLPRIQQLAGARSPSLGLPQRSSDSSLLSSRQVSHLSPFLTNRSPSPAVSSVGRSPSPATGTPSSQQSNSPQSSEAHPPAKKRRLFHRELKYMMHGFGDDPNPYSETVDLVEELVIQFIVEMTVKAMEVGKSGRVHVNDIIFIIRKDKKKYARVKDLLTMKEQIDKAKKAFSDESEAAIQ